MEVKVNSVDLNNQIFQSITLLHPQDGDVLMFHIKTDQYGMMMADIQLVRDTFNNLQECFNEQHKGKKIALIAAPDKFQLDSIENCEKAIKSHEKAIQYILEAMGLLQSYQNQKEEGENFDRNINKENNYKAL